MKTSRIKLSIINPMRHQNAAQKTETPAHSPRQRKTSSRDTYIFASQMNKLIEDVFPYRRILHSENTYPDGSVLHVETIFKTVRSAL